MTLRRLDHVTVNCADLDASRAFYSQALGLTEGARPNFGFPGAWFYLEERPVVHLVAGATADGQAGGGAFDHVAFEAEGIDEVVERMRSLGLSPQRSEVPGGRLSQVFVHDPDGVKIELNFRS